MFIEKEKVNMVNLRTYPVRSSSIVCTELPEGEAILLNLENKYFYTLNEIALRIWNLIDGRRSIADIINVLLKEYNINRLKVTKSVSRQIKEFTKHGLVKIKQ